MEFSIKLKIEELAVVGDALANLPYKQVAVLLSNIQAQVNEQEAKSKEAAE